MRKVQTGRGRHYSNTNCFRMGRTLFIAPSVLPGGIVVRIFNHYVSKMAFILLLLEVLMLLT